MKLPTKTEIFFSFFSFLQNPHCCACCCSCVPYAFVHCLGRGRKFNALLCLSFFRSQLNPSSHHYTVHSLRDSFRALIGAKQQQQQQNQNQNQPTNQPTIPTNQPTNQPNKTNRGWMGGGRTLKPSKQGTSFQPPIFQSRYQKPRGRNRILLIQINDNEFPKML